MLAGQAPFVGGKPNRRQRRAERTRQSQKVEQASDELESAVRYQRARDFPAAKAVYDRLLKSRRDDVELLLRVVEFYELQDDFDNAFAEAKRAVTIAPDNPRCWGVLASCLSSAGNFKAALIAQEKSVELAPQSAILHTQLAALRMRFYDSAGALRALDSALELDPRDPAVQHGYGNALLKLGRFEEAQPYLRKAHELEPDNLLVYHSLLQSRGLAPGEYDEAIRHIEACLARPNLHETMRVSGLFSLAEIHERKKDYDRAFTYYRRANETVTASYSFDCDNHRRHIDRLIEAFTPKAFLALESAGSTSQLPVFVVGMPRSGTTLVEQILASHPEAFGGGEMNDMEKLEHTMGTNRAAGALRYPNEIASFDRPALATIARQHIAHLRQIAPADSARVIDKLPNNFLRLGLIHVLFPKAAIIHCVRDPMDTCWSCYSKDFLRKKQLIVTFDLDSLGFFYQQYQRLMDHWRTVIPGRILDVRYEDLIARPEEVSRQMVAHLGLDWDERCLAFHEQDHSVHTASAWQVRQPVYTSSIQKWRRYEAHLEPLARALGLAA